jgi:hypothetical protein
MLRGNLATRPFYNERIVALLLGLLAVVAVGLTLTNGYRLMQLSARRSELRAQASADADAAARLRQNAVAVQSSVDPSMLSTLAGSAREANSLIDARTFSWTTFFSYIEDTIPMGVRLTAVSPEIEKGNITVTMLLMGRSVEDVATFMTALEGTGAFYDALPTVSDRTEEGLERVTVVVGYLPLPKDLPSTSPTPPGPGGGR